MKSYLSKLGVLLFGAMFAVAACQDYDEDIRKVNDELNTELTDLTSKLDAAIAELEGKHNADIEALQSDLEDLEGKIEDAKTALTAAYTAADAALKTELEGELEEQINAAVAQVEEVVAAYKAADAELNTKIEAAKQAAQDALDQKAQVLEGQIDGVKKDVAAVYTYIETELIPLVNKAINDTTLHKVLVNDFGDILNSYSAVECAFGVNDHDRTECAKTETTCSDYLYLVLKTFCSDLGVHSVHYLNAAGGSTSCTTTN